MKRHQLNIYISHDAHSIAHDVTAELGVSVTALLESMIVEEFERLGSDDHVVREARRLDAERRRRK